MAQAQLNFDENSIDKQSSLYDLYSRLYKGMVEANNVTPPSYGNVPENPTEEYYAELERQRKEYTDTLMKNSAYLYANSIITTAGGGGGGGGDKPSGIGFISRNGDSMSGPLKALYGFNAGSEGQVIFETLLANGVAVANVKGNFNVSGNTELQGELHIPNSGIYLGDSQVLYKDIDGKLYIAGNSVEIGGNIVIGNSLSIGDFSIDQTGLHYLGFDFYHSGNSNKSDVSWSMKDGTVYGNLTVNGNTVLQGSLTSVNGFALGKDGIPLFYSTPGSSLLEFAADVNLSGNSGVKFNGGYVLRLTGESLENLSFSAPGKTIVLGDAVEDKATKQINIRAGIFNSTGNQQLISPEGDGCFMNSFQAGCGVAGDVVLKTYYTDIDNMGVIIPKRLKLGINNAPYLYGSDNALYGCIFHKALDGSSIPLEFSLQYIPTTSQFADLSIQDSATLKFSTDAAFIQFEKPVEADMFCIKSEKYKTCLRENILFFGDNKYFEGLSDGIREFGNFYVEGTAKIRSNISSFRFSSGFAGYGWGIQTNPVVGGITATFDELVVRKKMRLYEMEVQKISVTNGSLWVSDSCSGDEVRTL